MWRRCPGAKQHKLPLDHLGCALLVSPEAPCVPHLIGVDKPFAAGLPLTRHRPNWIVLTRIDELSNSPFAAALSRGEFNAAPWVPRRGRHRIRAHLFAEWVSVDRLVGHP